MGKHVNKAQVARRTTYTLIVVIVILLTLICCQCGRRAEPVVTDEQLDANMSRMREEPAEEPATDAEPDEDVIMLAKIMDAEDGLYWPDWAIMAIGEVVLNRVESPEFPDSIHDVLYQVDPIQYAPVFYESWSTANPSSKYVELAYRLVNGERVLCNTQIVYQALFEQGRQVVISYRDVYLGTTTYFCLAD